MKNTFLYLLFVSIIVALFAFAFSFSQSGEPEGKNIFTDNKCEKCHSVEAAGIECTGKKFADLSDLSDNNTVEILTKFLKKEGMINDKEHKIKFKGSDDELDVLVKWLLNQKTK